ncbi:hypothetical protein BC941DRAFT_172436 [Chlamydoabsidia padenii]|nr:hypothetical protein BC941DRAFT_172436 [Chlamydoabsidia padenii]
MDHLPDEITLRIVSFITTNEWQLLELEKVSRKFRCIINDQTLWYQLFQQNYKNWGHQVSYASRRPLIDWKAFVIHLAKQKLRSRSFTFDFVPDESSVDPLINRKRKIHELARSSSSSPSPPSHKTLTRQFGSIQSSVNTSNDTEDNDNHSNGSYNEDYSTHNSNSNNNNTSTTTAFSSSSSSSSSSSPSSTATAFNNTLTDMTSPPPSTDFTPFGPSSSIPTAEPFFDRESLRHWINRPPAPFRIQDPLVVDINRMTRTGMVATGKHRKINVRSGYHTKRSEHKILFWEYPSWRLVRELEINFVPSEITCQVIGVQTVRIKKLSSSPGDDQPYQSIRLFALAIGQPIEQRGHIPIDPDHPELEDPDGNDDRVDLWQAVLIYRLYDDGTTQCLAHLPLDGKFMGREVFFFSEYSWTFGDTDEVNTDNGKQRHVKDWLQMIAPENTDYDPHFTLFMLAIGPTSRDTDGCGKLVQFDLRGDANVVDPSLTSVAWSSTSWRIVPTRRGSMPLYYYSQRRQHVQQQQQRLQQQYSPLRTELHHRQNTENTPFGSNDKAPSSKPPIPARIIHNVYLGSHVSCMIHFQYPTHLNHLICTGSYDNNELSVYDWRFGVKVGTLPWKVDEQQQQQPRQQEEEEQDHNHQPQQPIGHHQEQMGRNIRHIPLLNHLHHRQPPIRQQQFPNHPPAPPPTQTDHQDNQDTNDIQPAEPNINLTTPGGLALLDEPGGFLDQIADQLLQGHQDQTAMNISDNEDDGMEDDDDDDDEFEMIRHEVRPWGLESTMVLPPYWDYRTPSNEELAHRGFRLIAVGDNRVNNRMNRLEIKVWDISFLLQQEWDPLQRREDSGIGTDSNDTMTDDNMTGITTTGDSMEEWQKLVEWTKLFPWWRRGTQKLRLLGLRMAHERAELDERRHALSAVPFEIRRLLKQDMKIRQLATRVAWPLSPPKNQQTMLLAHVFDKPTTHRSDNNNPGSVMTVNYTAYNVLCTSLFLLTDDGKVTVMDIETGQVTGTIDNVAASAAMMGRMASSTGRVRGIDVNVVAGHEVVVTSREGLLRSVMS